VGPLFSIGSLARPARYLTFGAQASFLRTARLLVIGLTPPASDEACGHVINRREMLRKIDNFLASGTWIVGILIIVLLIFGAWLFDGERRLCGSEEGEKEPPPILAPLQPLPHCDYFRPIRADLV
jgi:hypothetical protein